ncbi:MAG: uracil-DNA glycosylase [Planctomycetes bacterium]|nr:uracil-DNA glycosylase [Planctomycetota bacterium]
MGLECVRPAAPAARAVSKPEAAPRAETPASALKRTPEAPAQAPAVDRAKAPVTSEQALAGLSVPEKAARWEALEARALACTRCALHKGRTKVVFGEGDRNARLVFVGEGPGEQEDLSGRPFVGKAGQLLDKIIGAMGLQREQVYICNIVKCRPPGNRTPLPDEVALCQPFLEEQLALLAPKAIVALGSPAAKALLKTNQGIMALRGRWQMYRGVRVMPTFHPAFVLRQYTEETRRAVWGDMQQVVKYLKET